MNIWGCKKKKKKNRNTEELTLKLSKMKPLAMHITNQKLSFDIFTKYLHGTWSLLNILMIFDKNKKIKIDHFDPYNVF